MKLTTTIEIDEIDTEVLVDFEKEFGEIIINKMTNSHTGDAIAPDLLGECFSTDNLYYELNEAYADIMAERRANGRNYLSC